MSHDPLYSRDTVGGMSTTMSEVLRVNESVCIKLWISWQISKQYRSYLQPMNITCHWWESLPLLKVTLLQTLYFIRWKFRLKSQSEIWLFRTNLDLQRRASCPPDNARTLRDRCYFTCMYTLVLLHLHEYLSIDEWCWLWKPSSVFVYICQCACPTALIQLLHPVWSVLLSVCN